MASTVERALEAAPARRRPTATSAFGVSRRENHDSSGFYARFTPPDLVDDSTPLAPVSATNVRACVRPTAARSTSPARWLFDVSGGFTSARPGLKRTDALWKALGKAAVLHALDAEARLVLLTTDTPENGAGDAALRAVCGRGKPIRDVIRMLDPGDVKRLRDYQSGACPPTEDPARTVVG